MQVKNPRCNRRAENEASAPETEAGDGAKHLPYPRIEGKRPRRSAERGHRIRIVEAPHIDQIAAQRGAQRQGNKGMGEDARKYDHVRHRSLSSHHATASSPAHHSREFTTEYPSLLDTDEAS